MWILNRQHPPYERNNPKPAEKAHIMRKQRTRNHLYCSLQWIWSGIYSSSHNTAHSHPKHRFYYTSPLGFIGLHPPFANGTLLRRIRKNASWTPDPSGLNKVQKYNSKFWKNKIKSQHRSSKVRIKLTEVTTWASLQRTRSLSHLMVGEVSLEIKQQQLATFTRSAVEWFPRFSRHKLKRTYSTGTSTSYLLFCLAAGRPETFTRQPRAQKGYFACRIRRHEGGGR